MRTIKLDTKTLKKIIYLFEKSEYGDVSLPVNFQSKDGKNITLIEILEQDYPGEYDVCEWEYSSRFLIQVDGIYYRYDYIKYSSFIENKPKINTTLVEVAPREVYSIVWDDVE